MKEKFCLFIMGCALTVLFQTKTLANELNHNQFEQIIFGKKIAELKLHAKPDGIELEGCQYYQISEYPNVSVMVNDGIVVRIDTQDASVISKTSPFFLLVNGKETLEVFKKKYPKIEVDLHEYQEGFYLRWYNEEQSKAIVVDYVEGKVDRIKAGLVPAALWIEGCA